MNNTIKISQEQLNSILFMLENNIPISVIAEKTRLSEMDILKIYSNYLPAKFLNEIQISSFMNFCDEKPVVVIDDEPSITK